MSDPNPADTAVTETQLILDQVSELDTFQGVDTSTATDDTLVTLVRNIVDPTTLSLAAGGDADALILMRQQMGLTTGPTPPAN